MHIDMRKISSRNPNTSLIEEISLEDMTDHEVLPGLATLVLRDDDHKEFDIKSLIIKHSKLQENEYDALYKLLGHCDHLKNINLSENHIEAEHAERMLNLLHLNQLHSFVFTDNWIGEKGAEKFISALAKQKDLITIDLSLDWLRDFGITLLAGVLKNNGSLVNLNLSCNDFHTKGLVALVECLKTQGHVASVDLSYNLLDVTSSPYISNLLSNNTSIVNLNIKSNQIGDAGAEIIAKGLSENVELQSLDMSDNKIEASGITRLIECAVKHKKLTKLNLSHNAINAYNAKIIKHKIMELPKKIEIII